jgi:hypothetical protein
MPSFKDFPRELILAVANLDPIKTASALARTNRQFRDVLSRPYLLKRNAAEDKSSALFSAIVQNDLIGVKMAIKHGANTKSRDKKLDGDRDRLLYSPLHLAAVFSTKEVVHCLIHHGAEIDAVAASRYCLCYTEEELWNDRHFIGDFEKTIKECRRWLRSSIRDGACRSHDVGITPLHLAICHGNTDIGLLLLEHGAKDEAHKRHGTNMIQTLSASYAASQIGDAAMLDALREAGESVLVNDHGFGLMHAVAGCRDYLKACGSIRELLVCGWDVNHEHSNGYGSVLQPGTVEHLDTCVRRMDQYLSGRGRTLWQWPTRRDAAPITPLKLAIKVGNKYAMRALYDFGARIGPVALDDGLFDWGGSQTTVSMYLNDDVSPRGYEVEEEY